MPPHDGVRLDDEQDVSPSGPHARERDPEEAVPKGQVRARATALEDGELLAQGEVLEGQVGARPKHRSRRGEEREQEVEHGAIMHPSADPEKPLKRREPQADRVSTNHKADQDAVQHLDEMKRRMEGL
jgi:hypothetical protein